MYADQTTDSMRRAIDETERRREKQVAYNEDHGIGPASIVKAIRDLTDRVAERAIAESQADYDVLRRVDLPPDELAGLISEMEKQIREAAEALEFEKAAALRDHIYELRQAKAESEDFKPWERARALAGQD